MHVAGDVDWSEFFERYRPMAVRFVRGLVRDSDVAEDLFQEAAAALFERAVSGAIRFESGTHARNYLFRALRNLASDHARISARKRPSDAALAETIPSREPAPLEAVLASEGGLERARRERALTRAVASLRSRDQHVLSLRFGEGLTLREIGERTGEPISTLHARLESALAKIRKKIGKERSDE